MRLSWRLVLLGISVVLTFAFILRSTYSGSSGSVAKLHSVQERHPEPEQPQQQQQQDNKVTRSQVRGWMHKAGSTETRGPGIVQLNFLGRLGNNLFEYAAARSLADGLGWALSIQAAPGNRQKYSTLLRAEGMACFPGVRPLGPSMSSPEMAKLKRARFRGMQEDLADSTPRHILMQDWFQEYSLFSRDKDRLRQIMALDPSCCGSTAPGANDLVIHYRNYRAELTEEQYKKLHFKDLDYEFYDRVLRDAANDAGRGVPETIWVVGEFDADDPLVARLQGEHPDVRKAEMVQDQFNAFCFLARAPRLVMAHSTFSWWVAFLGNATEVHFPLSPPGPGVTGPNLAVTGDPRYVYRDGSGRVVPCPAR